jgi:hypothetical protein
MVKLLEYSVGLARFAGPDKGWNDLDSERRPRRSLRTQAALLALALRC